MISTHVLDTSRGRPAAGVAVVLERQEGDGWSPVGEARTDADGRVDELAAAGAGVYRLTFDTGSYFESGFYPQVAVEFRVDDDAGRYHVPLLLSPFGYSTYRGS
jgi:5-hydroxyisourate hydrolase